MALNMYESLVNQLTILINRDKEQEQVIDCELSVNIAKIVYLFNIMEQHFSYDTNNKIIVFLNGNNISNASPIINKAFMFFKNRYITYGKINKQFDDLFKNKDSDDEKSLKTILLNSYKCNITEKLKANLIIAYRFRNNIFHGNKNICELNKFNDCYLILIEFLHDILKVITFN